MGKTRGNPNIGSLTGLAAIVCILTASRGAIAEPAAENAGAAARTSSLSWVRLRGAESCIATQALAQAVEKRLGRPVFVSASEADLSVEGRVERAGGGWVAAIEVRDPSGNRVGSRELKSPARDCSAIDEQLTFVLSVLIEPHIPPSPPREEPAPLPTVLPIAPPPREVDRVVVRVPVKVPAGDPPVRFAGHAGATLGGGFLPRAGGGVSLIALVEPRSFWGILVGGSYLFEQEVAAEQGARARASAAFGTAALCPLGATGEGDRLGARLCAGVHVGSLRSRGDGFSVSLGDEVFVAYASLLGQLGYRITGPLMVATGASLSTPIARGELRYRNADGEARTLFRASPVALAAHLGLGVRFP